MATAPLEQLVVAYIGNFGPPHSTENHVATAFESHGTTVLRLQENDPRSWEMLPHLAVNMVLWTRTWSLPEIDQVGTIEKIAAPVVGYHLDRWWGLDRQRQITDQREPFFSVDLLITADGGHDAEWRDAGITHRWLPPAVSYADAELPGHHRGEYESEVAFVGSHESYHPEWPHRRQLVAWAKGHYGRRIAFYPRPGRGAVRGRDLADLYATVPVVIGDSCLAGGASRYWSDRIPETLGRGGFLLHPEVEGLSDHFTNDEHLVTWQLGDFERLATIVDTYLAQPDERLRIAAAGRAHVLEHHTYERRVEQIVELARADAGML